MKKLIIVLISSLLFSCNINPLQYKFNVEVIYINGDKEIINVIGTDNYNIYIDEQCLYGYTYKTVLRCGVRKYNILNKTNYENN